MPDSEFDETYYQTNEQDADRPALAMYARIARRLVPPSARVLEFGAGHGFLSRRLAKDMVSSAFDISPYARRQISEVSPSTHVIDDVNQIEPQSFDLIVSLHVLEHIPDPSVTFGQFHRWLTPGGRLLFVVPNPDGWGRRLKGEGWFAYRDPTHCTLWTSSQWLGATKAAGFTITKAAADGLWDPPYVRGLPAVVQRPVFGAGAALSVLTGRMLLPARWGECLIVAAQSVDAART